MLPENNINNNDGHGLASVLDSIAKVVSSVSDRIKLIALIAIIITSGLIAATYFITDQRYKNYYPIIMGILLLVVIIGVFIDSNLERKAKIEPLKNEIKSLNEQITKLETEKESKNTIFIPPSIDNEIRLTFENIVEDLAAALSNNNAVFTKEIKRQVAYFAAEADVWGVGQLLVGPNDSQEYLLELYRNAQNNVFSTSQKDFFAHWLEPFGKRIVEANKISRSRVTRVFVFNSREEITKEEFDEMLLQSKAGIDVLVYLDEEDKGFAFPQDLIRDFTIIDNGEAIGLTESFGRNNNSARWHFNNKAIADKYSHIRQSLINGSEPFNVFQTWWNENSNITG